MKDAKNNYINTIKLELKVIEDLFIEPSYNPFDSESRFQSGIDELVDQISKLSVNGSLRIHLSLSSPPDGEDFSEATINAINRYCSVKIRECEQAIHDLQSQGKRDLLSALLLSFILIIGEFFIVQLPVLPEVFTYLLASGFGIIAWVILWPPLDKLLYEWRPCRRSQQIYKHIQAAEIVINRTPLD